MSPDALLVLTKHAIWSIIILYKAERTDLYMSSRDFPLYTLLEPRIDIQNILRTAPPDSLLASCLYSDGSATCPPSKRFRRQPHHHYKWAPISPPSWLSSSCHDKTGRTPTSCSCNVGDEQACEHTQTTHFKMLHTQRRCMIRLVFLPISIAFDAHCMTTIR